MIIKLPSKHIYIFSFLFKNKNVLFVCLFVCVCVCSSVSSFFLLMLSYTFRTSNLFPNDNKQLVVVGAFSIIIKIQFQ